MLILKLNTPSFKGEKNELQERNASQLSYPYNLTTEDFILLFFRHLINDSSLAMAEDIPAIMWNSFPAKNHFTSKTLNSVSIGFLLQLLKFFLNHSYQLSLIKLRVILRKLLLCLDFARALARQNDLKESPVMATVLLSQHSFFLPTLLPTLVSKFKFH